MYHYSMRILKVFNHNNFISITKITRSQLLVFRLITYFRDVIDIILSVHAVKRLRK